MLIKNIELINFRGYAHKTLSFQSNPELIIGPNGIGKTNLLEAIYLACSGRSFRLGNKDISLIKEGADWAKIDLEVEVEGRNRHHTVKLKSSSGSAHKSLEISQTKKLFSKNTLPVVLFEPSQLSLLVASPGERRAYLDSNLSLINPQYNLDLLNYRKALLQRNRLLKLIAGGKYAVQDLFIWNVKLSELGAKITLARNQYLLDLDGRLQRYYQKISKGVDTLSVDYVANLSAAMNAASLSAELFSKLERASSQDVLIGFTRHGPHKDDWQIKLNGQNAAHSASRGEIRSIILSLKLFEFWNLEKIFATEPVILLDDVMSELDATRRQELLSFFNPAQVIVTGVN